MKANLFAECLSQSPMNRPGEFSLAKQPESTVSADRWKETLSQLGTSRRSSSRVSILDPDRNDLAPEFSSRTIEKSSRQPGYSV
jgi:hypothetical protein